jgi:hypothetical protein
MLGIVFERFRDQVQKGAAQQGAGGQAHEIKGHFLEIEPLVGKENTNQRNQADQEGCPDDLEK